MILSRNQGPEKGWCPFEVLMSVFIHETNLCRSLHFSDSTRIQNWQLMRRGRYVEFNLDAWRKADWRGCACGTYSLFEPQDGTPKSGIQPKETPHMSCVAWHFQERRGTFHGPSRSRSMIEAPSSASRSGAPFARKRQLKVVPGEAYRFWAPFFFSGNMEVNA